jgi:Fe-S-cluster containining protein
MRFTCQMCGECCRRYAIPVTSSDVHRIASFTELNPRDFLTLMEPDNSVIETYKDFPKIRLKDGINFVLVLSQNYESCIFLKNNKCSIHNVKPLVCRPFPFEYSMARDGNVKFSVNQEARGFCKGLGEGSKRFNFTELEKSARLMESENDAFRKKGEQWNATVFSHKTKSSRKGEIIKFLITDINQ